MINELQIKRDEAFEKYTEQINYYSSTYTHFVCGWNACAEDYEKRLSLAKEALEDIVHNIYSNEFSPEMIEKKAREALVKIT